MAKVPSRFDTIELRGDSETVGSETVTILEYDSSGDILRATGLTVPTDATDGYAKGALFIDTDAASGTEGLYQNRGTSSSSVFVQIKQGSGGGGGDLDSAYSNGSTIGVDAGAIVLNDASTGAADTLQLNKTGAGSGDVVRVVMSAAATGKAFYIDMDAAVAAVGIHLDNGAGARTGADVLVTLDSTGTHSVFDVNWTGAGTATVLDFDGTYTGSPAGVVLDLNFGNGANLDTTAFKSARGTGIVAAPTFDIDDGSTGSAHIFDVDLTGVYTGDVFNFASGAAATGNVLNLLMTNAVAMTAIRIAGAGVRTEPFIELIGTQTGSANMIDLSADGAFSGDVINMDLTTAVGGRGIAIVGAAVRTANIIDISDSSTSNTEMIDINVTGINTGDIIDITYATSAVTGTMLDLNLGTGVAAKALVITGGNATRTVAMGLVTLDGNGASAGSSFLDINVTNTGATGSGLFDIDVSGVYTGAVMNIAYSAAATGDCFVVDLTSAVAAKFAAITASGARDDDVMEVNDDSTGSGHIFDVNMTGAYTGNIFDVSFATAAATGDVFKAVMGTNVSGSAIVLTGTGSRTDDMIKIDDDSTGTAHIFDINMTGIYAGNILDIDFSTAAATGDAIKVALGTAEAGSALVITGAGARTDDLIKIDDSSTSNACAFDINLTGAFTTNVAFDLNASGAHTSGLMVLTSNSADTGARNLMSVINDNTAAVGSVPLYLQQDAVGTLHFKTLIMLGTIGIYVSDQTTPNAALSAAEGSICLNGSATGQMFYNNDGATSWVVMAS